MNQGTGQTSQASDRETGFIMLAKTERPEASNVESAKPVNYLTAPNRPILHERLGHPRRRLKSEFNEGRYPPLDVPACSLGYFW